MPAKKMPSKRKRLTSLHKMRTSTELEAALAKRSTASVQLHYRVVQWMKATGIYTSIVCGFFVAEVVREMVQEIREKNLDLSSFDDLGQLDTQLI